jgi:hypothetical protein
VSVFFCVFAHLVNAVVGERKRKNKEGPPTKVNTKAAQEASPSANASAEGPAPTDALPLSKTGADSAIAEAETSSSPTTAAQDVSPPANVSAEGPAPTDVLPPSAIGADSTIADAETSSDPSSVSAEEFLKWYLTQVGFGLAGAWRVVDIRYPILRMAQVSLFPCTSGV